LVQPEEIFQCQSVNCGYMYNPDKGDRKGKITKRTKFSDLPDEWKCPHAVLEKKCSDPLLVRMLLYNNWSNK